MMTMGDVSTLEGAVLDVGVVARFGCSDHGLKTERGSGAAYGLYGFV